MEGHQKHTSILGGVWWCTAVKEVGMVPMQCYRSIVKGQCSYRLLEVVETLMDLDGLAGKWIK
jgi:hypothetical protein